MKPRISIAVSLIALIAVTLSYPTNSVGRLKKHQGQDRRPISLVIEEGHILPSLLLGKIRKGDNMQGTALPERPIIDSGIEVADQTEPDQPVHLSFTILNGGARFQDSDGIISLVEVADGIVSTPTIVPGPLQDESSVNVSIGGKTVVGGLRVATLPSGGIENLLRALSPGDPAVIVLGDHFAVVDENKLVNVPDEAVMEQEQVAGRKKKSGDQVTTQGLCIRTPFPPGLVYWYINNPAGAGFSIKPETSNQLRWASTPSNAIDGIYNRSWGCGVALKVPDSCTVSWYSSYYTSCCNAVMAALGYVPKWVNPGSIGWPNCPLR